MDIKGKVAVITGAGSGMGAGTARYLANAGAKIALLDKNINAAKKVAAEINALAIECDVTNEQSVKNAIAQANNLGEIRVAVNCAGIINAARIVGREGPMSLNDFKLIIEVNLIGTFNVMRLVADEMIKLSPLHKDEERGVIINTASIAAFEGQIGQVAYSASKGGVVGMTLPAARDLAKFGVRVITIAPGLMDTPMVESLPEEARKSLAAGVPFPQRLGKAEEYAQLVSQVIENSYLNGTVIRLDGALRMTPK